MNVNLLQTVLQLSKPSQSILQDGQVVRGIVLRQLNTTEAIMNINGLIVKATLEQSLPTLEPTLLRLQKRNEAGQLLFKPVLKHTSENEHTPKIILNELGLKGTSKQQQVVSLLLQHKIPIDSSNIALIQSATQQRPDNINELQWERSIIELLRRGIKPERSLIASILTFKNSPPLHQLLSRLIKIIVSEKSYHISEPLRTLKRQVELVQNESMTLQAVTGDTQDNVYSTRAGQTIIKLLELLGLKQQLFTYSHVKPYNNESNTIKALLIQNLMHGENQFSPQFREIAQQLLQYLAGQQILFTTNTEQALTDLCFPIPLFKDEGGQTAQVWVEARKKGKQLDLEHCRLYFELSMSYIGPVAIDILIVNRYFIMNWYNDKLSPHQQSLREAWQAVHQTLEYETFQLQVYPYEEFASRSSKNKNVRNKGVSDIHSLDIRI